MEELAKKLGLQRDLAFFDLETTGVDPRRDRIVEFAVFKLRPDGSSELFSARVNPERPIPASTTAIHGIRDEDVAGERTFGELAEELRDFLEGADLAGFNLVRFDIPVLANEFERAGLRFSLLERQVIDAQTIFHRMEPRTLSAAYSMFVGGELQDAHSAAGDAKATAAVLLGQLQRYEELPHSVGDLDAFCRQARGQGIDLAGRLAFKDGEAVFTFGKYRGRPLRKIVDDDPRWLEWAAGPDVDFLSDFKDLCSEALAGRFPEQESAS